MVNTISGEEYFFAVPSVPRRPWGIVGLACNILPVAGLGSIIVGAKGDHRGTLVLGIIHALVDLGGVAVAYAMGVSWVAPLVFGVWVWSIIWGIRIVRASRS